MHVGDIRIRRSLGPLLRLAMGMDISISMMLGSGQHPGGGAPPAQAIQYADSTYAIYADNDNLEVAG